MVMVRIEGGLGPRYEAQKSYFSTRFRVYCLGFSRLGDKAL